MSGELGARSDAELAVGACEVCFDGALADEQAGRDFPVGLAVRGQFGDTLFGRCQLVAVASRAAAEPVSLGLGAPLPQLGAEFAKHGSCRLERGSGGAALFGATLRCAEREQGAGVLEPLWFALEDLQSGTVVVDGVVMTTLGAGDHAAAAQRARDGDGPGQRPPAVLEVRLHGARAVEVAGEHERFGEVGVKRKCERFTNAQRQRGA